MNTENKNQNIQLFQIADEILAIEKNYVKDIVENTFIRYKNDNQNCILGTSIYKNKEIPIVDGRMKFDLPKTDINKQTPILVLEIPLKEKTINIGLVVDGIKKQINMNNSMLISLPKINRGLLKKQNYFKGMLYCDSKFVLFLKINEFFCYK